MFGATSWLLIGVLSAYAASSKGDKPMFDDYRKEIWGMNGNTPWSPLLPSQGLAGIGADANWSREGDAIIGGHKDGSAVLMFAENEWRDYEVDFQITVLEGANVDVGVRHLGTKAYKFQFLLGWQAAAVSRFDSGGKIPLERLSVVNHRLERDREYHVQIAARGSSITTYIDGSLVNQTTHSELTNGKCFFEVWQGKAKFRNIRYRRIS